MNIFILHRDFRIYDNKGLIALSKEEKEIYLIFILTNEQIKNNKFFNLKSFQAMIFCLKQLNKIIHINVLKAENELNAIRDLINQGIIINKEIISTSTCGEKSDIKFLITIFQNSDYSLFITHFSF